MKKLCCIFALLLMTCCLVACNSDVVGVYTYTSGSQTYKMELKAGGKFELSGDLILADDVITGKYEVDGKKLKFSWTRSDPLTEEEEKGTATGEILESGNIRISKIFGITNQVWRK